MSALEYFGTDLLTEPTPDGPDYYRICHIHEYASWPAASPDDTGRCPFCALEFDLKGRAHTRYEQLLARLNASKKETP